MNNTKGLSQILYLIIAASVLMIAALSMVLLLNEGLSGIIEFGGEAENTGCERALQAACSGLAGGQTVNVPSSCVDANNNVIPPASTGGTGRIIEGGTQDPDGELSCVGPNTDTDNNG